MKLLYILIGLTVISVTLHASESTLQPTENNENIVLSSPSETETNDSTIAKSNDKSERTVQEIVEKIEFDLENVKNSAAWLTTRYIGKTFRTVALVLTTVYIKEKENAKYNRLSWWLEVATIGSIIANLL